MFAGRKGAQGPLLAARSWLFPPGSLGDWLRDLQHLHGNLGGQLSRLVIVGPPSLSSPRVSLRHSKYLQKAEWLFSSAFQNVQCKDFSRDFMTRERRHASCSEQLLTVQWKWNEMKTRQHYYVLLGCPLPTRDRLFLCLNGSFKRS